MSSQLLQQFLADLFETLLVLFGWSEDTHVAFFRILKLFLLLFCICNSDFIRALIPKKCTGSM